MAFQYKKLLYISVMLIVLVSAAFAVIKSRVSLLSARASDSSSSPQSDRAQQATGGRNLSLQPEAFNLSRRLGKRFSQGKREQSVLVGTIAVGAEQQVVRVIRRQTDEGERVEIVGGGFSGALTWDAGQCPKEAGERAVKERDLIERLVLDSPDQFVLAQLRGASYYTVARNVRADIAVDDYTGALWNIVRVDEPQRDKQTGPRSQWRLYYLNARTGLIDKIVSEIDGERLEAVLSDWKEVNGEKIPTEITWTRQGETVMQFRLTNFSHAQQ
jgi:hypothetical protein